MRPRLHRAIVAASLAAVAISITINVTGLMGRDDPEPAPEPAALGTPEVLPFSDRLVPGSYQEPAAITHDGARPQALTIDAIGLSAPTVPVGINPDGSAEVPRDIATVGWYAPLGTPRDEGSTVLVGHVNGDGRPGAFHRLGDMQPGDQVVLDLDGAGPVTYEVATVDRYPKDRAPLADLYTPTGPPRLVLITCGGEFNQLVGHYRDNVVVTAFPAGS